MSELRLISPPPRAELLERLQARLGHLAPGARVIAQGVLGADAPIDFVAVDPAGGLVLVLVGEHDQDLELVGLALAQRAWVQARRGDWIQLAPNLGLRPDGPVRALVVCPAFDAPSRAALAALGPDVVSAGQYRCVQRGGEVDVLVEHVDFDRDDPPRSADRPLRPVETPAPAPAAPEFRTGLSDADLGLTPEERREFE